MTTHLWWRASVGIVDNAKVQALPDKLFKNWINMLCIAKRHDGVLPPVEQYAFEARMPISFAKRLMDEFQKYKLVDDRDGSLVPHDWTDMQYEVTPGAKRQKRYRDRHSGVTRDAVVTDDVTPAVASQNGGRERARASALSALNSEGSGDFSERVEKICKDHPKQSGIEAGKRALSEILKSACDPEAVIADIERRHIAWCKSIAWREENGRYVPKLSNWFTSGDYLDPIPESSESSYESQIPSRAPVYEGERWDDDKPTR